MAVVLRRLIESWISQASAAKPNEEIQDSIVASLANRTPSSFDDAELRELVEEFIRFATEPGYRDAIWARHTLELLRQRITERKGNGESERTAHQP